MKPLRIKQAEEATAAAAEAIRLADLAVQEAAQEATQAAQQRQVAQYTPAPVQAATGDAGSAKAFIYAHESGNRPGAINPSSGACGLGQALPCSKMGCSLSDYACQDAFFTAYMESRYGTWQNAEAFWLAHSWW